MILKRKNYHLNEFVITDVVENKILYVNKIGFVFQKLKINQIKTATGCHFKLFELVHEVVPIGRVPKHL